MALPESFWPPGGSPNPDPNPSWGIEGLRQDKKLSVSGIAYLKDAIAFYDSHSDSTIKGKLIVSVSPVGAVTRPGGYESLFEETHGQEIESGVWQWGTYFEATVPLGLIWNDGPITVCVRFTGTSQGEPVEVDSPVLTLTGN